MGSEMCIRDSCRTVGIEYMHISDPVQKQWIQEQVEGVTDRIDAEEQRHICLLYTSDAADERSSVDLGGRRIIKKKKKKWLYSARIR